jgi:hypothetical protein
MGEYKLFANNDKSAGNSQAVVTLTASSRHEAISPLFFPRTLILCSKQAVLFGLFPAGNQPASGLV